MNQESRRLDALNGHLWLRTLCNGNLLLETHEFHDPEELAPHIELSRAQAVRLHAKLDELLRHLPSQ